MYYFEADVARGQTFTSNVIKVQNIIHHKFSHGATFYTLNGKNVVMLESAVYVYCIIFCSAVCPQTESTVYPDKFFEAQDLVVNALDNVEARRYVDR